MECALHSGVSFMATKRVMVLHSSKLYLDNSMNAILQHERESVALVTIVDFKWLMAHEGRSIHVERLQSDADYARACLAVGDGSSIPALRKVAATLRAALFPAPALHQAP
jgi:hypothetical protein